MRVIVYFVLFLLTSLSGFIHTWAYGPIVVGFVLSQETPPFYFLCYGVQKTSAHCGRMEGSSAHVLFKPHRNDSKR
jgi:hypothetical protein